MYRSREVNAYKLLHNKCADKMRLNIVSERATHPDDMDRSKALRQAYTYIEESVMGKQGALSVLHTIEIPSPDDGITQLQRDLSSAHQALDNLLMAFAHVLLALENACVDETHDNIRAVSCVMSILVHACTCTTYTRRQYVT
jgi:hypothetical protein